MDAETIDPRWLLAEVAAILGKLKISYAVAGGMAIYVWGRPRFTSDIDIVIELASVQADALVKVLKSLHEAGYIEQDAVDRAIERHGEFNFIDGQTGVKVDFWVLGKDEFSKSQLKRRVFRTVRKQKVYFVSAEDLILSKLLWHRESESSKQIEDIKSVLEIQRKLDWKYLSRWSKIHKTVGVFKSLRKRVGRT